MRFRSTKVVQDTSANESDTFVFENFKILNRSADKLKFLILHSRYDFYSRFSLQNGYVYVYLVDLSNQKIKVYTTNLNAGHIFQEKEAAADLHSEKQSLIIEGSLNQMQ